MKIIKTFWQLPQYLLGLVVLQWNDHKQYRKTSYKNKTIYFMDDEFYSSGVSFGEIILIRGIPNMCQMKIQHEYGHSVQSEYFGPLYLIVIGIPSVLRVLWYRGDKENRDYYGGYPENWANRLGGVE